MALIDGPPADYEDEAAADKDAGGTPEIVEDPVVPTVAATISSSVPAPATVADEAPMDNGMQRARSSSVEDWEKHELEMEALLASLQTDIIDIDTGDGDGDGGSRVERTPLPPLTASADKAPPDVIAAPAPHTERHEPPVEPGEAMANQRSHDHTDKLEHTNEWVRSASDGDGDGGGVGAMSAKEREIEELQRKLRELEERLTAGSSDSPAGSLLLPSLLPPSFTSTPAHRPASSLRPLSTHSPSIPASSSLPSLSTPSLPSAPSPSFAAASQHHQASPGSSPPAPPSSAASPSRAHPPPRRAGTGSGDTRLAAEVIDGLLADNPAADLDLLVPAEQQPQPPTRVPASGGGGGAVSLPPDRRDLFAASLYLSPVALPSASASSASSSAQRRGRTGSALSPSSLSTASSSSFVPSSPLSSSASSLTSTSTSSLASSASAAAQRARRSPDAGAEQQQTAAALSGVGAGQRRQVLFHLHKRGSAADQNYLCAGCSAQFGSCTPTPPPRTHPHE
jgi:hypothetical protein